ncbi:DUF3237 family protein [Bradyrhizobium sp. Pear77]|nr:DUF3237 family protein [Bradyrhizobium altum]
MNLRAIARLIREDWQSIRPDATAELDIRCVLKADDGAVRANELRPTPSGVRNRKKSQFRVRNRDPW